MLRHITTTPKQTPVLFVILTIALSVPFFAFAETVLRVGDSVTIAAGERVEDDFYGAGGTIAISGAITGDMYAVGGSVTTNGTIGVDLTIVGGTVAVHGPVGDDVRVVGGEVTIADTVAGDVFVIGGVLTVLSSATIEGDIFFYGGEGNIEGSVGGSVMGTAERFRIDSAIGGDIDVTSSRSLTLGDRAVIRGNVQYESFGEITRAQNAVVEGEIIRSEPERGTEDRFSVTALLMTFAMSLFAALGIFALTKRELPRFVKDTVANYGRSGVLGIAVLLLAPVGAVLLMLTMLGLIAGMIGLFLFLFFLFVAMALVPVTLGGLISFAFTKRIEVSVLWIAVGALALSILLMIPFVGPLSAFALMVLTLGNLVWTLYRRAF